MFFGNVCPKAESSRAWSGCRYDRGKTRPLGTGRDVPICLSPLRFVVFPIFRLSFRPSPPVHARARPTKTVGHGRASSFFQGTEFLFFLFLLSAPADRSKALSGGTGTFLRKSAYSRNKAPAARGGAGYSFSLSEDKVKKFDVFFGILRKVYLFYDIITNIIKITFRA